MRLTPAPLSTLLRRAFRELPARNALFDLPARRFYRATPAHDLSVRFHGRVASTPFGPAAGPHSQLAQNIALSWLAGARVVELKTVQVRDDLVIPRPCIDMQTVGYNVEWSQELRIEESLEEYVKAAMLVRILAESGLLGGVAAEDRVVFDMSVGYDLAGISSDKVGAFIEGLRDATPVIDRLRRDIPPELARFRDLDFDPHVSDTVTLSTFHGCPPGEIERIVEFLLQKHGLHCIVKLNPMLLGPRDTRRLLNDDLGYQEIRIPEAAFERDPSWDQMCGFVDRLGRLAATLGRGFGVKFTNTLIVENHRQVFPASEREMYLSGPPLHVLAIELVRRFRRVFGNRFPVSFSAGIDAGNFADGVALGLVPVTVCSDLLKPGGYGRAAAYFQRLRERMDAARAAGIDDFVLRAFGFGASALDALGLEPEEAMRCRTALETGLSVRDAVSAGVLERWRSAAVLLNTEHYADAARRDGRYARESQSRLPRKIGRHLQLFDCISCDKCIPVCPNDAIFSFVLPQGEYPVVRARRIGSRWDVRVAGALTLSEPHQIGTYADFCNDCGNCDVFCPEDGGPYVVKPRFFGSEAAWRDQAHLDGFFVDHRGDRALVLGRFAGREYRLQTAGSRASYSGAGFAVTFDPDDPLATLAGDADEGLEVDLGYSRIMLLLRDGLFAAGAVNYVNAPLPVDHDA